MPDENRELSDAAREEVLDLAYDAVKAAVTGEKMPVAKIENPELELKRGLFVTLKNGHLLRGCLGRFEADIPLARLVPEMAAASATQDSRFFGNPITPDELPDIGIKISVLSPLKKVSSPDEVKVGEHGIQVTKGWRSGCYLPEVATDNKMSRDEFLTSCCRDKAGLAPDAWKDPDTGIMVFTSEAFGDD